MDNLLTEAHFDFVHRGIEVRQFGIVVKQSELRRTAHQFAEAHTHEPNHHPAVVEAIEDAVHRFAQNVVEGGVRDALLHIVRIEVGVTDFHRHATRQFALRAQVEAEAFHHPRQALPDGSHVNRVLLKRPFLADGLPLLVRAHGRAVLPIGFLPDVEAVLAHRAFHRQRRQSAQGADFLHAHRAEQMVGLLPHHRDFLHRERVEERINIRCGHFEFAVGLGLSRRNLRHGLVFRQAKRNRQARFVGCGSGPYP